MPKSKVKSQTMGFLERAQAITARAVKLAAADQKHSSQPAGRQKRPKQKGVSASGGFAGQVALPAARATVTLNRTGGMSDLKAHTVRYLVGYLYVGNGTLGANDQVYFALGSSGNSTVYKGIIPIAPADASFGQSYIADVVKHYALKRVRRVILSVKPYGVGTQSTAGISFSIAPYKSGSIVIAPVTDTTSANLENVVQGMRDCRSMPSWEGCDMDLTSYISNASGGNVFTVNTNTTIASRSVTDNVNAIPCGFAVAGTNAGATSNRGLAFATVSATVVLDTIDFIGGFAQTFPASPAPQPVLADSKESPAQVTDGNASVASPPIVVDGEWEMVKAVFPNETIAVSAYRSTRTGAIVKSLPPPRLARQ